MMRVRNSRGPYVIDPKEPRLLIEADPLKEEAGSWQYLPEGIDNDADGQCNEDGLAGVNLNRNFPFEYAFFTSESGPHPVSEVETRALAQFVCDHPNIGIIMAYGSADTLMRCPETGTAGRQEALTKIDEEDAGYYRELGELYRTTLGLDDEGKSVSHPGTFSDWMYFHRGRFSLAACPWNLPIATSLAETTEAGPNHKEENEKEKRTDKRNRDERRWLAWFDPANHSFPTLGAPNDRKVEVAWNRFYDTNGLVGILGQLHEAFAELTRLHSIGQSSQGKDIWCIEITALQVGDPTRKPGMHMHANIHGNEVQTDELLAYTAWYLCHQYGRLDKVTSLLNDRVFYIVPTINPDGRDDWFHSPHTPNSSRTGLAPTDNDRDGQTEEDGPDDLNGDGVITMMRTRDVYASPRPRYKPQPDYPEQLMVRAKPGELGQYCLLDWEGVDNDGDGRINEDGPGGYDMNRNWRYDWQPDYIQGGARLSLLTF